jgi:hypothetical protein
MSDRHDHETTIGKRPLPKRPPTGLLAWEATVGYMSAHHSPDTLLKLQAYPRDKAVLWSAHVSWAQHQERVQDRTSLAEALRDLWVEVEHHHTIFQSDVDAIRSPRGYGDGDWVDAETLEILDRLTSTAQNVFPGDWTLIVVYHPVESASTRVQARLLVQNNSNYAGGRGPSVHDACHAVYRGAARLFVGRGQKPGE